jgi:hypothetical protein
MRVDEKLRVLFGLDKTKMIVQEITEEKGEIADELLIFIVSRVVCGDKICLR